MKQRRMSLRTLGNTWIWGRAAVMLLFIPQKPQHDLSLTPPLTLSNPGPLSLFKFTAERSRFRPGDRAETVPLLLLRTELGWRRNTTHTIGGVGGVTPLHPRYHPRRGERKRREKSWMATRGHLGASGRGEKEGEWQERSGQTSWSAHNEKLGASWCSGGDLAAVSERHGDRGRHEESTLNPVEEDQLQPAAPVRPRGACAAARRDASCG